MRECWLFKVNVWTSERVRKQKYPDKLIKYAVSYHTANMTPHRIGNMYYYFNTFNPD